LRYESIRRRPIWHQRQQTARVVRSSLRDRLNATNHFEALEAVFRVVERREVLHDVLDEGGEAGKFFHDAERSAGAYVLGFEAAALRLHWVEVV
jgi:hypothetical protein